MLETNKPYMFGSSSTTTTTTTTPPPSTSTSSSSPNSSNNQRPLIINDHSHQHQHLPGLQPSSTTTTTTKPLTNGYYSSSSSSPNYNRHTTTTTKEEEQQGYNSYHGQPTRLGSAFGRHQESYSYKDNYKAPYNNSTTPVIIKREEPPPTSMVMPPSLPPPPTVTKLLNNKTSSPQVTKLPPVTSSSSRALVDQQDHKESKWFESNASSITATAVTTIPTTTTTKSEKSTTVLTTDSVETKRLMRRKEMTNKMEKLNQDFLEKREAIYTEKMISINGELKEIRLDMHPRYLDGLKSLEENRKKMIHDGQLFREYQNQVTDNQFQLEIYQAEEEYTAETQEIREKLFAVLEEKRRKLKEDKDNCDLAYDVVMESQARLNKRNLRKRGLDNADNKGNKRKQLTGPALVFKLRDEDILYDIQAMKHGLSQSSSNNTTSAYHNHHHHIASTTHNNQGLSKKLVAGNGSANKKK